MRSRGCTQKQHISAWFLLGLLGCSGVTDQTLPHPTVVTLGPAGGSLLFPDSASVLIVPAGALASDVAFTVSAVTGVPSSGLLVAGTVYAIEPAVQFSTPVTLRLSYARASLPPGVQEPEIAVHRLEGRWVAVEPSSVDPAANFVQAELSATDTVGLLGRAATIVSVSPAAADLFVGDSLHLTATPLDALGGSLPGRAIAWSSDNAAVAQVRNDGTVIAGAVGSASVSAYTDTAHATVRLEITARPPQSALYPNQPYGAMVLMDFDTDFGQISAPPWDVSGGTANLSTVFDITAPMNPNVVGRVRFAPGCCGGTGPARLETYTGQGRGTPPAGWKRWYVSDWVKLSSGWSPNAEGIQTIMRIFVNAGGGPGAWIVYKLDGIGPYQPRITVEYPRFNANLGNGAVSASAGQWYHYETVVHSTGRIQFWVNATLIYDGTPAPVQFAGEFLVWSWEHGGVTPYGGSSDGYIYHNHIRTSYTTD